MVVDSGLADIQGFTNLGVALSFDLKQYEDLLALWRQCFDRIHHVFLRLFKSEILFNMLIILGILLNKLIPKAFV